jgi:hypothetical protein
MKPAIGYLRVSTREQGRSGLGLAAQRLEIETFGTREGFAVSAWYQDMRTHPTSESHTKPDARVPLTSRSWTSPPQTAPFLRRHRAERPARHSPTVEDS